MGAKQAELVHKPMRKVMPIERMEIGRKFQVGEYEGYIHVGLFPDGTPGDVFVDIAKEGTTLAGLMNALMISVSLGLQYGVPLDVYVSKFSHMRFEPSGLTNDPDIRVAKSLVDYIFRWLGKKFLDAEMQADLGIMSAEVRARLQGQPAEAEPLADGTMYGDLVASPEGSYQPVVQPVQTRRPARALQRLGGRAGVREVRRPQDPHRLVLHLPRLRRQLRLRLSRGTPGGCAGTGSVLAQCSGGGGAAGRRAAAQGVAATRLMAMAIKPTRYPNPRGDDAWDDDAVQWLLEQPGVAGEFTRGTLFECARRQPRWLQQQPDRVERAAIFCRRHHVLQLEGFDPRVGKTNVRLKRTDPAAPPRYPAEYDALQPVTSRSGR